MTGIVRGSLDAPPIVLRRRRSWSFLILPVSLAVVSCLVWGVRLGLLDRLGRLLSIWPLMICIPVVALCANQIAHPSVLTLSPEGVTQRRGGSTRKRRWTDIPGLVVSEEGSEEPEDESVELGVESAGAEIIWLDPVIPADQLEALFRAAQARWAPGDVIGPIRQSPNLASLRLGPALAAILVFATSMAANNSRPIQLISDATKGDRA